MAKSLREFNGKQIIHDYLVTLIEEDVKAGNEHKILLPPYRSVGIGAKTDTRELTGNYGWLEKYVS